jgi:hypothetical protein
VDDFAKAPPSPEMALINSSSVISADLPTQSTQNLQDDLTQSVDDNSAEPSASEGCICPFQPTAGAADSTQHDPQRPQCEEPAINPPTNVRAEAKVVAEGSLLKENTDLKSFAEQLIGRNHQAAQELLAQLNDMSEYDQAQFKKAREQEQAFNSQFMKKAEEVHEKIKTLSSNPKKEAPTIQASQTITSTERQDDLNKGNSEEGSWKDYVLPIALIGLGAGCVASLVYLHHSRKGMGTTPPLTVLKAVSSTQTTDRPLIF